MKKGRAHQRHLHQRNKTPAVICLPPPAPPLVMPRKEPEALRAFVLPQTGEPLVSAPKPARKRKNTVSKTRRRRTTPNTASAAKNSAVKVKTENEPSEALHPPGPEPVAPLPRNMSLALPRQSALVVASRWLRKLVVKRRSPPVTIGSAAAIAQITSLREEVARLQTTLDRLLDKATAPQ